MKVFGFTTTSRAASIAILASFIFSNAFAVGALRTDNAAPDSISPMTAKFATDLTLLGREGRLREDR